ncbi:Quercetin 2,3-dioxygenase Short=Quercetinase; AltName: Full=Pirin-like protein YhhW [Serendipita indica DSM 11827]|uniref:Pirin N-terminal domain-containing protein n=1 Tax=Serendipita indica (strain DSM 11827) TaxID=1109443 RepID=G4TKN2_SERID|nr:Quercetin 2,3-dioxygenase Short=Quercetinase; AltName: Full=Pirin-like protein YhhW [Serendipita indica DSM 11827]CCA71878.1 hypothetical protein PIIN_05813 [Serendipita indica DSM 11827]
MSSAVEFVPRRNEDRGHANHGWLKTFHTFSFAGYQDYRFQKWGSLRVINEDRVAPGEGFGTHGHKEFEIFSFLVSGELEHRDSMGNKEVLKRGDIQLTSAGTGISHSEMQHKKSPLPVHFLQIWAIPRTSGLPPKYYNRHFTDEEKRDTLVPVVAPVGTKGVTEEREGSGPAPVQSNLHLFSTILSPGKKVTHNFLQSANGAKRKGYLHVIQTSGYNKGKATGSLVKVNSDLFLSEGDGAFAQGPQGAPITIENVGDTDAEVLLFDIE